MTSDPFEHCRDTRVQLQELTVLADTALVEVPHALKPPARHRSIRIDRAPIVFAEERTTPIAIRDHAFDDHAFARLNRKIDRPRSEPPAFIAVQEHRILMPILLAARRVTFPAGTC